MREKSERAKKLLASAKRYPAEPGRTTWKSSLQIGGSGSTPTIGYASCLAKIAKANCEALAPALAAARA